MAFGNYTAKEKSPAIENIKSGSGVVESNKTVLVIVAVSLLVSGSAIGAAIHVSYISQIYFNYATTTSVTMVKDMDPELPAITICMYLKNTFNDSKFYEKLGYHKNRSYPIPPHLTVVDINELGINMDDIIIGFRKQFLGHPEINIKDWGPTSISIHVNRDLKCITMFKSQNHGAKNITFPFGTLLLVKLKYFLEVFGDHEEYENLYRIYVHTPNANIGEVLYGTSFEIKAGHTVILKLRTVKSILRPAPYDTDCLDYSTHSKFQTRADCVDQCLLEKFFEEKWPREIGIDLTDNNHGKYDWSKMHVSEDNLNSSNQAVKDCQLKECKKDDCNQNHIELSLVVDKVDPVHFGTNTADLFVWLPTEPGFVIVHNPKMELVEYISYLGSIVSLWFGMSVLTTIRYVRTLVSRKAKICCQSVEVQSIVH